mmetsp:Transcript_14723/g.16858  ORF Transcript_14723/g.16858 Transcript_14723/m.16858 type:complete len:761 (+) Transcript_14723:138-2420(+)
MNYVVMKSITMTDSRRLQEDGKVCSRAESLVTPLDVDVTAFGTMFTLVTKEEPIEILTLEFFANPTAKALNVEIYTKLGDYKGFENNSTAWEKISETAIAPPPSERHSLLIPMSEFKSFTMYPNEMRAIFITLQTSDFRYKYGYGLKQGQTYHSDGYLSVNVGIGHANYGFGKRVFPARLFSGILHYSHNADCTRPRSKTVVHFTYYTRPKGIAMRRSEMVQELDRLVRKSMSDILNEDMLEIREINRIILESIETGSSTEDDAQEKCPVDGWVACVKLESKVTLSHLKSIQSGYLQYLLLEKKNQVTKYAQTGSIQVSYSGLEPKKAEILLAFKGVPKGKINTEQKLIIEEITSKYLSEETVGLSNAVVLGAKITHQRGPGFKEERFSIASKNLIASRTAKGESESKGSRKGWIELRMDVLGTVKPPYTGDIKFEFVVKKAFNQDEEGYIYNIKRERTQLDSQGVNESTDYFLGINQVLARLPNKAINVKPENKEKILGLSEWHFISACTGLLIAGILSYLYVLRRTARTKGKKLTGESQMLAKLNERKSSRTFASSNITLTSSGNTVATVSSNGTFPSGGMTFPTVRQMQSQTHTAQPQQFSHVPPQQYIPPPSFSMENSYRTDGSDRRVSGGSDCGVGGSSNRRGSQSLDHKLRESRSRSRSRSLSDSRSRSSSSSQRSSGSRSLRSSVSHGVRSSSSHRSLSSRKSISNPQTKRRPSSREQGMQGDGIHRKDPLACSSRSSKKTSIAGKRSNGVLS